MNEALAQIADAPNWYHNIELAPGIVTNGRENLNSSITRELLRRVNLNGRCAIDIGTMDAFYGVLMERKGASPVFCFDRLNRERKIAVVRKHLDASFQYIPETTIKDVASVLSEQVGRRADFVNAPGVLYHMYDPMAGLARFRGMTRRGGLVLVDTPAFPPDAPIMLFNRQGHLYTSTTYFVPSLGALQGMLERVGLFPIDCRWGNQRRFGKRILVRVAVMCRAWDPIIVNTTRQAREGGKTDRLSEAEITNLLEFLEPDSVFAEDGASGAFSSDNAEVEYQKNGVPTTGCSDGVRIDLPEFCRSTDPTPFDPNDNVLHLNDRS
jgi:hypothetical protein